MYEFGKFRFDPANHLLLSGGDPVPLTPKVLEILLVLVQNGGRLTTKEALMRRVWPNSCVEEANLTVNISTLRRILGETADGRPYIQTVPKKGYRFVAPVAEVAQTTMDGDSSGAEPVPDGILELTAIQEITSQTTRSDDASNILAPSQPALGQPALHRLGSIALGFILLAILATAAIWWQHESPAVTSRSRQPRSLAVLPFQNLRADEDSEFLGFSLADAVITKLGYVSELSVRPSYAVRKYKSPAVDMRRIATDLNVDTILTGTFLRDGNDLRITCQLIDAQAKNILWKGSFDLKYEKLLTVQDSVANRIIKGLEVSLSPSEAARLNTETAITPLAYEYYLRGIDLYSMSDFPMAIRMLEKSTQLAPDYALTWAHLGKSYTASASFQFGGGEQYQKAQRAFERALALQSDQIDARIYMANMFTDTGRVERAVPLLRQALAMNPNRAETHWELGYAYRFAGMLQESVSEAETARRLDPGVKLNSSTLNGYLYLQQYERFLDSLPKNDDQALITFYRGFGEYYQKNWAAAAAHFDHALELDPSLFQAQIGKALSLGIRSHVSEGLLMLHQVETRIDQRGVGDPEAAYKIAQGYAVLGDRESALRVLGRSIDSGFFPYPYLSTDPLLDSLRNETDFVRLMSSARQRHVAFAHVFFPGQTPPAP
ncbi:MAG: winged helix-turn-helix domain-containing tetratricopeptide repeat protein [Candidatus Udaeobacter sp.]